MEVLRSALEVRRGEPQGSPLLLCAASLLTVRRFAALALALVALAAPARAEEIVIPDELTPYVAAYTRELVGRLADERCRILGERERAAFHARVAQNGLRLSAAFERAKIDRIAAMSEVETAAAEHVATDFAACPEEARVVVWRAQSESVLLSRELAAR